MNPGKRGRPKAAKKEEEAASASKEPELEATAGAPPKSWSFISRYLGYTFPDPRFKPPRDPYLVRNWERPMIQFVHGVYTTRDPDEARAIYNRWKSLRANGINPDFQPIDRETAERFFSKNQPQVTRGTLSVETGKPGKELRPPVDYREELAKTGPEGTAEAMGFGYGTEPSGPEPGPEAEKTEAPKDIPGLDEEFAPSPGG